MTELQDKVLALLKRSEDWTVEQPRRSPEWLQRPGLDECKQLWPLCRRIYEVLTNGLSLPESMPPKEGRKIDAILVDAKGKPHLFEFDESQHFTPFRATTLGLYPAHIHMAFPIATWIETSSVRRRLPGGGFGKPCPPLFPMEGGRHLQRAFRDALADLLPFLYGFGPTIRIAHFEVSNWINSGAIAQTRLERLMCERLSIRQPRRTVVSSDL